MDNQQTKCHTQLVWGNNFSVTKLHIFCYWHSTGAFGYACVLLGVVGDIADIDILFRKSGAY